MNRLLDAALVATALAASAIYAMYSLGPKTLRRRLRMTLADLAARAPAALHLGRLERRLREAGGSGACGGCESCESSGEGARPEDARGAVKEFRVPAAGIGKRR
jgi:hypothetical protein